MKNNLIKEKKRTFGGKISGFYSRENANFERAHLKNYLAGNHSFTFHGFKRRVKVLWL